MQWKYNCSIVCPKVSWAGLICRTHQHYHHKRLPNTEWSNSRRSDWARDRWLWRERLWEHEGFKTSVEKVSDQEDVFSCTPWLCHQSQSTCYVCHQNSFVTRIAVRSNSAERHQYVHIATSILRMWSRHQIPKKRFFDISLGGFYKQVTRLWCVLEDECLTHGVVTSVRWFFFGLRQSKERDRKTSLVTDDARPMYVTLCLVCGNCQRTRRVWPQFHELSYCWLPSSTICSLVLGHERHANWVSLLRKTRWRSTCIRLCILPELDWTRGRVSGFFTAPQHMKTFYCRTKVRDGIICEW